MTMNLSRPSSTSIRTHQICSMPQRRVVESIVTIGNNVLVAHSHSQPVIAILFYLKCHFTCSVPFLLQWRLQKTKVVIVSFSWFYQIIRNQRYTIMLHFTTELEVYLTIKQARILRCFLQYFTKRFNLSPNFCLFCFQIFLHFLLNSRNRLLNLRSADLTLILLLIKWNARQKLLHQGNKSIIFHFFHLNVFKSFH